MKEENAKVLIIRILEACNAGCFMCSFAFSKDEYRFSVDEAKTLCKQLKNSSIEHVRFTGGEPIMHEDIWELVKTFKDADLTVSTITNGFFLEENIDEMLNSGLDQLVISLDSPIAKKHNKYRRTDGLFEQIETAVRILKAKAPHVKLRVNSVIGGHNIDQLNDLYDLLVEWKIDQWSIIPLKNENGAWKSCSQEKLWDRYQSFQTHLNLFPSNLQLLGHSRDWAGRTQNEFNLMWSEGRHPTPRKKCHLVDQVMYYVPNEGMVYPCNCLPHRIGNLEFGMAVNSETLLTTDREDIKSWLRENGPTKCTGCEPVNAALGEGLIDLEADIFGY